MLSWYETSSAYFIVDDETGREACCGDGVDMFETEGGDSISPGTPQFDQAMDELVKDPETKEAYFG
jgi:hypothetical protein